MRSTSRSHNTSCHADHISSRRGAAHALIASMLVVFGITVAFSIDYAYMQLVRTELRTATDAAAKAVPKILRVRGTRTRP